MKDSKWFPGHMKKALEDIEEKQLKPADLILYVLDSRAPFSCINPLAEKIVHGKKIVYVFNKCDLADEKRTKQVADQFKAEGKSVVLVSANNQKFKKDIKSAIMSAMKDKLENRANKSINYVTKIIVLGVPNTGKSTLINLLCGSNKAKTGNIAGVTRFNTWQKVDDTMAMLDSPGILWPRFDGEATGNLAFIGCLSDKEFDMADMGYELMKKLFEILGNEFFEKFNILPKEDVEFIEIYDELCGEKNFKIKGGEIDYARAGKSFVDDFRAGKFGRITLE